MALTRAELIAADVVIPGNSSADAFIPVGSTVPSNGVYLPAANSVAISTNGSEAFRIDSNGRLTNGVAPRQVGSILADLQIEGTDSNTSSISIVRNSANAGRPFLVFGKTRSTTVGGFNPVINNDFLGTILWCQPLNGSLSSQSASISAFAEGAPSEGPPASSPGYITIGTTPTGATDPVERLRINSAGQIAVAGAGSAAAPTITKDNDLNTGIFFPAADTIAFAEGGSEAMRIDSSGRLLVGTSTARGNFFNSTGSARIQIEGASSVDSSALSITLNEANDASGTGIILARSKGGTVGSNTLVGADAPLGAIYFQGADGTEFVEGARIQALVDGTPGANDMPGRLVFSTTADGASSPTERMRITSTGQVRLAGAGITFNGDTATANELDDYEEGTWGTATWANRRYTKVGSLVHVTFEMVFPSTGTAFSSTLPFPVRTGTAGYPAIENGNWFARTGDFTPYHSDSVILNAHSTSIALVRTGGGSLTRADLRTILGVNVTEMFGSITYITNT